MRRASSSVDLSIKAELALRFTRDGVRLLRQDPPLRVVRSFGPLVHLHNLSGGVLSGDHLRLNIEVDPGACAQITTTGATRIYRCERLARQTTNVHVGADALLEYLPDPLIPFAGAQYAQSTSIQLDPGAGLFWWELLAPGRTARGETYAYRSLAFDLDIRSTRLIARERIRLAPDSRPVDSPTRMGHHRHASTFFICKAGETPDRWTALEEELNQVAQAISRPPDLLWGASTLAADGLIIRGAAVEGRMLPAGLHRFWTEAKHRLYQLPAIAPRKVP